MSQDNVNEWISEETSNWVADSASDIAGSLDSTLFKSIAMFNVWLKGAYVLTAINNIDDSNYDDNTKTALKLLIIANTLAPPIIPASIEMTFAEAWDLVSNVPQNFNGGTKQQFFQDLATNFPGTFELGPDNELSPPEFLEWSGPSAYSGPVSLPTADSQSAKPVGEQVPNVTGSYASALVSPLVLDVDASGTIELAALNGNGSVYWDSDVDGFREATGWITGGDGLLCIDLNSDGVINDQTELFGNNASYANGYLALDAYDTNSSDTITSADTQFGNFRVWIDTNADGISQSGELHTLSSLNITSIATTYTTVNYQISGNDIKQQSTFVMNGNTYTSVDAWFATDQVNSRYAGDYTLDTRVLFLPNLRGYGALPDLYIAMSLDESLLELVQEVALASREEIFDPSFDLDAKITEILYTWAGVEGVSPTSRGDYVDAQKLEFIEKFMGQDYFNGNLSANPDGTQAEKIEEAWQAAFHASVARIMVQTSAKELFLQDPVYSPIDDEISGVADIDIVVVEEALGAITFKAELFDSWVKIFRLIDGVIGLDNVTVDDEADLNALLAASGSGFYIPTFDSLKSYIEDADGVVTDGDASANILIGSTSLATNPFTEDFNGYGGNDLMIGHRDKDWFYGGTGDDTFLVVPGDSPEVQNGDFAYELSNEGTDTVVLSGVNPDDVSTWADQWGFFYIKQSGLDLINLSSAADNTNGHTTFFEKIVFDDGTVWDLTQGLIEQDTDDSHVMYGGNGADVLSGNGGSDSISGYAGNDLLKGGSGNDTFYGGDGTDTVSYEDAAAAVTASLTSGTASNDGDGSSDTFSSGVENLTGSAYNDTLTGDSSANVIEGLAGNDTMDGEGGTDTVSYSRASAAVTVSLATATGQNTGGAGTDTISDFENLTGSAYADTLTGDGNANTIDGGDGDDTIEGGTGNDVLTGGNGTDTVSYANASAAVTVNLNSTSAQNTVNAGTDTLSGFENLYGSAYNDTLSGNTSANTFRGGAGNDTISGNSGQDTIDYSAAAGAVNVDLSLGTASNDGDGGSDTLTSIENVIGSAYADTITGTSSGNVLRGGGGNDTINGIGSNDTIYGDDGNDTISGGDNSDTLIGGNGTDTINGDASTDTVSYIVDPAGVTINLTTGTATDGWGNTDTLLNIERATGSSYADTITGTTSGNILSGGAGNDTIIGSGGTDTINGEDGDDLLSGGTGNDVYDGGSGTDTVTFVGAASSVTVNLSTGSATGHGTDTLTGVENIIGSGNADNITGDGNANVIEGGAGNDTLTGGLGTDTVTYVNASGAVTVNLATATAQNTVNAGTDTISGFENLTGSIYGDTLTGDGSSNVITARDGNDIVEGGSGDDTLTGGNGTDMLTYANASAAITISLAIATAQNTGGAGIDTVSGFENLTGSAHNDTLIGESNANTIDGGDGNDTIEGGAGNDTLTGGNGTDTVSYLSASGAVTVNLATATGQNTVNAGTDTLSGFENLYGSAYGDTLTGNNSDNVFRGGAGNDTINGSSGQDTIDFSLSSAAITVDLSLGTATGEGTDALTSIERVIGSAYGDIITGTTSGNILHGGGGNDTIYALGSNDTVYGDGGDDVLYGDDNSDTLYGGEGNDTIDGNGSTDTVSYADDPTWVTINLVTGTAIDGWRDLDTLLNIERATGSAYGDTITGNSSTNILSGGAGNDTIIGNGGADAINGEDGDDLLSGGTGTDTYNGGNGTDTVSYAASATAVTADLSTGSATGQGTDTFTNIENLIGSANNDTLTGDGNANVIEGGSGNDTMTGGLGTDTVSYASASGAVTVNLSTTTGQNTANAGTDTISGFENLTGSSYGDTLTGDSAANTIIGGVGNDSISGGDGNDILEGDAGTDTLTGGNNADTFLFKSESALSAVDTIADFSTGASDKIDIVDLLGMYDPLTDAITDFVEITTSGSNSILKIDIDGTGTTYSLTQIATISGVTGLTDEAALVTSGNLVVA